MLPAFCTAVGTTVTPLIVVCIILAVLLIVFKMFKVTAKILWKILINGIIGALVLLVFNVIFYKLLGIDFFHIPITWPSALVAGVLGIPGVILLLLLKLIV